MLMPTAFAPLLLYKSKKCIYKGGLTLLGVSFQETLPKYFRIKEGEGEGEIY